MSEQEGIGKEMIEKIEWRLFQMMAERKIRTATKLKKELADIGVSISSPQLGRLLMTAPQRLSMDLFAGLMIVLRCSADDLIRLKGDARTSAPSVAEAERPAAKDPGYDVILGPKGRAFPKPRTRE